MISRKDLAAAAEKVPQPPKAEVKLFVEEFVAAANLEVTTLRHLSEHWMQSLGP